MTNTTTKVLAGILAALGVSSTLPSIGCGQDVATCASVAAQTGAAGVFDEGTCNTQQATCTSASTAADFQAYLTCLGNEGTLSATDGECVAIAKLIVDECGGNSTTTHTSSSSGGSGVSGCSRLSSCCELLPAGAASQCESIAGVGDSTACTTELGTLTSEGFCPSTGSGS